MTNFLNYKDLEELPLNAGCISSRRQGFVSGVCAGSADCLGSPWVIGFAQDTYN